MTQRRSDRQAWLVALGLFALALPLRLINAGRWSFWVDEILVVNRAQELMTTGRVVDDWPKLSLLLNGLAMQVFGVSEWSGRIVSIVLGAALVPVVYMTTFRLLRPRVAFLAALFLTLSPWHIFMCQNARYYSLLILLLYAAMVTLCGGDGKGSPVRYAVAILFFALAFSERLYAALALPPLAAYGLYRLWPRLGAKRHHGWWRYVRIYLVMMVVAVLGAAAVILWVRNYLPVFDKILSYIGRTWPTMSVTGNLSKLISDFGMPLVALGLAGLLLPRWSRIGLVELASLLALHSLVVVVLLGMRVRVYSRYIMYVLPCWAIMAGACLDAVLAKKRIALVVVAGILPLTLYDRLWDDVAYFVGVPALACRTITAGLCAVVLVVWSVRAWSQRSSWPRRLDKVAPWLEGIDSLVSPAVALVLVYALVQPLITDALYHYQDGWRLDWEPIVSVLEDSLQPHDVMISGEYAVIRHYLGRPAVDVRNVNVEDLVLVDGTIWFVADHHSAKIMENDFRDWVHDCCEDVAYTGYMGRGHWWDMTLYKCPHCQE